MRVVIIGGGAAGLISAGTAGMLGDEVTLLEKNDKLGKKLYITGKGRCNVTNADMDSYKNNIISNQKFMLGALQKFSSYDTIELLNSYGVQTKTERGNRVFPVSDRASDIIKAFERYAVQNNAKIIYNATTTQILATNGIVNAVKFIHGNIERIIQADKVIIATGGLSYPATGSTGDGYDLAESLGHTIVAPHAGLVGIDLQEDISSLAGVSLKNVSLRIIDCNQKVLYNEFGEMLFTHTGISGPLVLSASSMINKLSVNNFKAIIDLKPALTIEQLDKRIINDFNTSINKQFRNALDMLLIKSLQPLIIAKCGINEYKQVNGITKEERSSLINAIKNMTFSISKLGDINGAIVTCGGVNCKEVNPKTMESKLINGLFFAGEVLDIDALTGGYNIQIALSTGYCAGLNY